MKKPKLRLDKAALQEFFIQNVEKIVFGLLAMVFLFMVYSAIMGVERYSKTPQQLQEATSRGQSNLAQGKPNPEDPVLRMDNKDYDAQVTKNHAPLLAANYPPLPPWGNDIFAKRPPRDAPAVYAVRDLRGTAGVGAFSMTVESLPRDPAAADDARDARRPAAGTGAMETRGQRWIVITALVPIAEQEKAFAELKDCGTVGSYDPNTRDVVEYSGYIVERVEVNSPADIADPNWAKAKTIRSGDAVAEALKLWGGQTAQEQVEQKYLFRIPLSLVFPLGQLMGSVWTDSIAHPPEIPLQVVNRPGMGGPGGAMPMGGGGVGPRMPMGGGGGLMPMGGGGAMPGMPMGGGGAMPRAPMGGGGAMPRAPMGGGGALRPGAPPAGAGGGNNPFGGNNDAGEADGGALPADAANAPPAHFLFRFFDFNVSPGKCYIYRVRIGLRNPNNGLPPALLKDPTLAKDEYLLTKWSDPSAPVSVPGDSRILAVSVTRARESTGSVLVTKWSRRKGIEAFKKFSVVRGQVIDFANVIFKPSGAVFAPGMGMPGGGVGPGGMMPGGAGGPGMMAPQGGARGPGMVPGGGRGPGMVPGGGMGPGMMPGGGMGPGGMMPGGAAPGAGGRAPGMVGPGGRGAAGPGGLMPPGGGRGGPTPPMTPRGPMAGAAGMPFKVNYFTHTVAVDLRGGELLRGRKGSSLKLSAPGEILLLDPNGNLIVRDELDDKHEYEQLTHNGDETADAEDAHPSGVRGAGGRGGAMDNLFNHDGPGRRRPPARGPRE
jgi:hypothetical protein